MTRTLLRALGLVVLLVTCLVPAAAAHDLTLTEATLVVRLDRTWQLDLVLDLDALALGVGSDVAADLAASRLASLPPGELDATVARLEAMLGRRVRVLVDGKAVAGRLSFPQRGLGEVRGLPSALGLVARWEGALAPEAETVAVRLSRGLPAMVLTVLDAVGPAAHREAVELGGASTAWVVGTAPSAQRESTPAWASYLWLGVLHIVPRGPDHILFVLGLFLLTARLGPLLWQVSAFTVAHTSTLALAATGVVALPSRLVESAIAASIAWVGISVAVRAYRRSPEPSGFSWGRLAVVFGCGLLHGLGFAGVLGDIGLPDGEFLAALVGFNVGVEVGQLLVLATAAAVLVWWRGRTWYPRVVVLPLALLIALAGLGWTVERAFGLG